MSTKNCDNCEHEDKREPFNYGDCEECKRFHIDADETFKDVWTQKVTNDYEKEFDEKFCPKGIGQCKVLNTEDPCDACKLVWNAACEMMSSKILELEQIIKSCNDGFVNCVRTEIEQFLADIKDKEVTNGQGVNRKSI